MKYVMLQCELKGLERELDPLEEGVIEYTGARKFQEYVDYVLLNINAREKISHITKIVNKTSLDGVPSAVSIMEKAAKELIFMGDRVLANDNTPLLYTAGGVLNNSKVIVDFITSHYNKMGVEIKQIYDGDINIEAGKFCYNYFKGNISDLIRNTLKNKEVAI